MKREYRILGPLEVRVDGQVVSITAARPRTLLAVLLLHPDETVPLTRLVDAVWGTTPPATADQLMRVYVSQLRRAIGDDAIVTRPQGYALAPGDEVDAALFRRLIERADDPDGADPHDGLARYEQALELWRGDVLAGTPVEANAAAEVRRLEELRLHAEEQRFDLELRLGRHSRIVPELEQTVRAHPMRERLVGQLMLALYRSGRQADALDTYQSAHRRFADLGLTPGAPLRQLQQDILNQEPHLDAPPEPRRKTRRPKLWIALGAAGALAIGLAVAVPLLTESGAGPITVRANSLVEIDPHTGKPTRTVRLAGTPGGLVAGSGRAWVVDTDHRTLDEVDLASMRAAGAVGLRAIPHELVDAGGTIWAANGFIGTLSRIAGGSASPPFPPEPAAIGRLALAAGGGSLWAGSQDGAVSRLDAATGRTIAVVHGVRAPQAIAVTPDAAWVAQATSVDLVRIANQGNRIVHRIPLGDVPQALVALDGAVWALTAADGAVWRIDPRTNSVVARIAVGPNASSLTAAGGSVWVASEPAGTLTRIDVTRNAEAQSVRLGRPLGGVTGDDDELYVTTR